MLTEFEERENAKHVRTTEKVENLQTYFLHMLQNKEVEGITMHIIAGILYAFSLVYEQLVNIKLLAYKIGLSSRQRLSCYVISLGNITVGGTGKTPTAQKLARIALSFSTAAIEPSGTVKLV